MLRITLATLVLALPAFASDPFPDTVKTHLGLALPPPTSCSLCHLNGLTGLGTVNTPFGKAIRAKGAMALDTAKLKSALDALGATDSDGDGMSDVDELKASRDPNLVDSTDGGTGGGAGGGGQTGQLKYGCGASVVPELSALALLALFARRRR